MKNTRLFIYSTNILVRLLTVNMKNCLTPNNPKMCDPILVNLLKMRPHHFFTRQSDKHANCCKMKVFPLASLASTDVVLLWFTCWILDQNDIE